MTASLRKRGRWPPNASVRTRSAKLDLATVEIIKPGDLVPVPAPVRKIIEPSAFAAYKGLRGVPHAHRGGQGSIAPILSGAIEIAKRRGLFFLTHRELADALEGVTMLAYSLALAIAVAAGPARAQSLCATVIQTTGAMVVLRQPAAHEPALVRDARSVIETMLEL
jgi:hypothetical protein